MGTTRMGCSADESVVDAELRCHDHENLSIVGGSVFPTVGTSNPTLTITALALRLAERLFPPREAMTLSVDALAKQFGLWEQVAEFDRRLSDSGGDQAASLLLTLGNLTLDEPEIFFPVYARHTGMTGWILAIAGGRSPRWGTWTRTTVHAARAFEIFSRIERLYPGFPRMDEALFRQAAALAGLYVQLKESPLQEAGESLLPFYGCRRKREDKRSSGTVVYRRLEAGWTALRGHWPTQRLELLEALPIGVSAVCEDLTGVGVFWDEQGERADVEHIAQTLRALLNPQGPV